MTEHTPASAGRFTAPAAGRRHPAAGPLSGISLERVSALVEDASGADSDAIEALEVVVANLRRARAARDELAATVPPDLLRQVLVARSGSCHQDQLAHIVQPASDEAPVRPGGRA